MDGGSGADFVRNRVREDIAAGRVGEVVTRFPPEPNGFLHIGHAKSIALNFDVAREFGGRCNLRFDDTNPVREEQAYVDAIREDVRWLGYAWSGEVRYASDYFEQLYGWAEHLIRTGHAYVDDLPADRIREYRGTLTELGRSSPYRDRPVEERWGLLFNGVRLSRSGCRPGWCGRGMSPVGTIRACRPCGGAVEGRCGTSCRGCPSTGAGDGSRRPCSTIACASI